MISYVQRASKISTQDPNHIRITMSTDDFALPQVKMEQGSRNNVMPQELFRSKKDTRTIDLRKVEAKHIGASNSTRKLMKSFPALKSFKKKHPNITLNSEPGFDEEMYNIEAPK